MQSEHIARAALKCFDDLPRKAKPRTQSDGRKEWTPLSAIVIVKGNHCQEYTCVSLGPRTGTKCLPNSILPACKGTVLHDSHAEILAIRGFNRWLLQEVKYVLENPSCPSAFIRTLDSVEDSTLEPCFALRDEISIHMFSTEAPCGDASMDLIIAAKGTEDSEPWLTSAEISNSLLRGRGFFSELGCVRRKPARGDAEHSLSKSCSDKIAIKQFTGLLAFPVDTLVLISENAYLSSIVVYHVKYHEEGYQRAFGEGGRLNKSSHASGHFFDINVLPTTFESFPCAKDDIQEQLPSKPSNISAIWVRGPGPTDSHTTEILMNGVKQGFQQLDPRIAKQSVLCRYQMWRLGSEILTSLHGTSEKFQPDSTLVSDSSKSSQTYSHVKSVSARLSRIKNKQRAIEALGDWPCNTGDENWSLDK